MIIKIKERFFEKNYYQGNKEQPDKINIAWNKLPLYQIDDEQPDATPVKEQAHQPEFSKDPFEEIMVFDWVYNIQ